MLLSIVFAVIALLLVTVVVSATSVHLERKQLLMLADDLALAGADSVALDAYYGDAGTGGRGRGVVPLTDAGVRGAVEAYLSAHPEATAGLEGLTLDRADTPEGRTARVTLTATATPALLSWVTAPWSDGIAVQVTSSARAG